jgi:hypothetical protein
MARQLTDVLELEQENENLRETLRVVKSELHRIRIEYLDGALSLGTPAIEEVDEELETVVLTVENALF